ncbi:hypothetical protein Vi05172_g13642 [Venturia inaequalis]|uniref:Serine-threonine protein kinase 19 n=1 Tax=Venturia inaequalis TaxID=5025 RepID=A0A8H3YSH2_VENIN|nr:hypothetical protein EG327_009761 [Venturia inaequalis]RDI76368.1 hypothetical protein Vi05172_g13642 [Venturia inaequalis]
MSNFRITSSSTSASRIQKPSSLRRKISSPFSTSKRKKPTSTLRRKSTTATKDDADEEDILNERLQDDGLIASLANDLNYSDVAQLLRLISGRQWTPIPEKGAGMNSTRIAEVLNYRRMLPPIVSVPHVHALSKSPTSTEREISTLLNAGVVRRITIPGRGKGSAAVGEGLALVSEWEKIVQADSRLDGELKDKYVEALRIPSVEPDFTKEEIQALSRSGLLVRAHTSRSTADLWLRPGASTLGNLVTVAKAGSKHASGSFGAVAEESKDHLSGGSGGTRAIAGGGNAKVGLSDAYTLSIPNTGPYLKLLEESRAHLVTLLSKTSRFREAPLSMLRERWDGGVAGDSEAEKAQRARREWTGVLPGQTKKWKSFHGLQFDWVLEEAVGSGVVECFRSGVGTGVRAL